jgi:hypothetical protein
VLTTLFTKFREFKHLKEKRLTHTQTHLFNPNQNKQQQQQQQQTQNNNLKMGIFTLAAFRTTVGAIGVCSALGSFPMMAYNPPVAFQMITFAEACMIKTFVPPDPVEVAIIAAGPV